MSLSSPTTASIVLGTGAGPFSVPNFIMEDPNGVWTLTVVDVVGLGNGGELLSWTLDITAPLMIWIDGTAPQRPTIDLPNAIDTGASEFDNVTNTADPVAFTVTADPGTTVISQDTVAYDAVRKRFELTEHKAIRLRGKKNPLTIYQVVRPTPEFDAVLNRQADELLASAIATATVA